MDFISPFVDNEQKKAAMLLSIVLKFPALGNTRTGSLKPELYFSFNAFL